jgi:hypothetical protein
MVKLIVRIPEKKRERLPLFRSRPATLAKKWGNLASHSRIRITTERVPWACGKNQHTYSFRLFLATWANRLELASRTGRVSQRLDGSR